MSLRLRNYRTGEVFQPDFLLKNVFLPESCDVKIGMSYARDCILVKRSLTAHGVISEEGSGDASSLSESGSHQYQCGAAPCPGHLYPVLSASSPFRARADARYIMRLGATTTMYRKDKACIYTAQAIVSRRSFALAADDATKLEQCANVKIRQENIAMEKERKEAQRALPVEVALLAISAAKDLLSALHYPRKHAHRWQLPVSVAA